MLPLLLYFSCSGALRQVQAQRCGKERSPEGGRRTLSCFRCASRIPARQCFCPDNLLASLLMLHLHFPQYFPVSMRASRNL